MRTDIRLANRIARGDRRAFEEFVDAYGGQVQRLVRRYALNAADAEDLTQEIFLDLYRSIGGYRGESSLATWVYRVALNGCSRYRQRRAPETYPLDDRIPAESDGRGDPGRAAARGELRDTVHDALDELTPMHKEVVVLHELHGMTYQECAAVLNVPVGTVKSRLSNAFRRLRDRLGEYVIGEAAVQAAEAAAPEVTR